MTTSIVSSHAFTISLSLLLLCSVGGGACSPSSQSPGALLASEEPTYSVHAYPDQDDPFLMHLELKVRGTSAIEIREGSLPWGVRRSIILVGAFADGSGLADLILYIDDPGPGHITLQPAETVKGTIDLRRRFWHLQEKVRETDVIVFWSYQLKPVGADALERVGGWVLLPRQQ